MWVECIWSGGGNTQFSWCKPTQDSAGCNTLNGSLSLFKISFTCNSQSLHSNICTHGCTILCLQEPVYLKTKQEAAVHNSSLCVHVICLCSTQPAARVPCLLQAEGGGDEKETQVSITVYNKERSSEIL